MTPLHSPIALKKGDRIVIGCYDSEKPSPENHLDYEGFYDKYSYEQALKQWQQSYKEYAVKEADENEAMVLLQNIAIKLKPNISWVADEFKGMLSSGIPCDELIPRLELKEICQVNGNCSCNSVIFEKCHYPVFEWTLKPLSVQSGQIKPRKQYPHEIEAVEFAEWVRNEGWQGYKSYGYSKYGHDGFLHESDLYQLFKNRK